MANIIGKAIDAIFSRGESKQIKEMRERGKERDKKDADKKTDRQLQIEKNVSESMKINDEESLV